MNKLQRKYIHNHWWFKRKNINQQFINHICNKFNIKGQILNHPYIENDEYIYGKIKLNQYCKKFNKYKKLLEFNDFYIIY
jgi:hypothetical protein